MNIQDEAKGTEVSTRHDAVEEGMRLGAESDSECEDKVAANQARVDVRLTRMISDTERAKEEVVGEEMRGVTNEVRQWVNEKVKEIVNKCGICMQTAPFD